MAFEGTIQAIAQQFCENLDAEICTIRVPRGGQLKMIAAFGNGSGDGEDSIAFNDSTVAGQAAISGQIIDVPDISKDKRYSREHVPDRPKCLRVVPTFFEGTLMGVIQTYRHEPFSQKQISFANSLAQFAAITLYHIEISKMNRQAILDVVESIFEYKSFEEMSVQAVKIISNRLDIPSCLIYRVFMKEGKQWCKIVAGVPEGEHKIGWEDQISNQPHIESAVNEKKLDVIDDPLNDPRTKHLADIIVKKGINAMLLDPLLSKNKDRERKEGAIGVLVLDACVEKKGFSAEERSFAFDSGRIIAQFIDHDEVTLKDIEDRIRNPNHALLLYVKRLLEPLAEIHEISESVCQSSVGTCAGAEKMCRNANMILPRAIRLELEANKTDRSINKIRESSSLS